MNAPLNLIRQQEVFHAERYQNVPIHIIGAGALGSRIWLNLVEIGLTKISVYDFDTVEEHNLANQIFMHRHIGSPKVEGLRDYFTLKTGKPVPDCMQFFNQKITSISHLNPLAGIVILAVDRMDTRDDLFNQMTLFRDLFLLIDVRMASSYGNVFTVQMGNMREKLLYQDSIIHDDEAEVSSCGTQISVSPTASTIAATAVWQLMNVLETSAARSHRINLFMQPFIAKAEDYSYYERQTDTYHFVQV